jgi:NADPH oxidase
VLETPLKKVAFYWTCRNESEFNSFKDIMVGIVNDPYLGQIFELTTYLTGELNLKMHRANEKYHQFAGRPDWNRIGRRIGEEHPDDDIGVFLCGPAAMARELSAMCKKLNPPPSTVGRLQASQGDSRSRKFK